MANQPMVYQIRLEGHLSDQWTAWFEGLTITQGENSDTLLTGPVVDQAALYGLLRKVRDLGSMKSHHWSPVKVAKVPGTGKACPGVANNHWPVPGTFAGCPFSNSF